MEAQHDEAHNPLEDLDAKEVNKRYAGYLLMWLTCVGIATVTSYGMAGNLLAQRQSIPSAIYDIVVWGGPSCFFQYVVGLIHPSGNPRRSSKYFGVYGGLLAVAGLFYESYRDQWTVFLMGAPFLLMAAYFHWWYKPKPEAPRDFY